MVDILDSAGEALSGASEAIADKVADGASSLVEEAGDAISEGAENLASEAGSAIADGASNLAEEAGDAIANGAENLASEAGDKLAEAGSDAVDAVSDAVPEIPDVDLPKDAPIVKTLERGLFSGKQLTGGDNNDHLTAVGVRGAQIDAGAGDDYVNGYKISGANVNLGPGNDTMDTAIRDSRIDATQGADTINLKDTDYNSAISHTTKQVFVTEDGRKIETGGKALDPSIKLSGYEPVHETEVTQVFYTDKNSNVVIDGNTSTTVNLTDGTRDSYLNGGGKVNFSTPNKASVVIDRYGDGGFKLGVKDGDNVIASPNGGTLIINGKEVDLKDLPKTLQLQGVSGGYKDLSPSSAGQLSAPDTYALSTPSSPETSR